MTIVATTLRKQPTEGTSPARPGAVACGAGFGALAMTCCSVGILGAATWGAGVSAGFFAFDEFSPVGERPVFVVAAFLLSALVAWLVVRRRVAGLPSQTARAATRRAMSAALLGAGATYFVLMQFVMPLLFLLGVLEMGQFFTGT